jgi:hypothetical protein
MSNGLIVLASIILLCSLAGILRHYIERLWETIRPKLRLHLSTAIILMIVAGGLMWLNMHRRYGFPNWAPDGEQYWGTIHPSNYDAYGWPAVIWEWYNSETDEHTIFTMRYPGLIIIPFVINFVVALAILFSVGFCCEYLIHRRREARKP